MASVAALVFTATIANLLGLLNWGLGWGELLGSAAFASLALVFGFALQAWYAFLGFGDDK
jgi:hypothetical protein